MKDDGLCMVASDLLEAAWEKIPRLTWGGVGVPGDGLWRLGPRKDTETVKRELAHDREELKKWNDAIMASYHFMIGIRPIKTINPWCGSYGLKHKVESWTRGMGHQEYVPNGAFIAAAVGMGYPFKIDGPNVFFAYSKRDLKEVMKEAA